MDSIGNCETPTSTREKFNHTKFFGSVCRKRDYGAWK